MTTDSKSCGDACTTGREECTSDIIKDRPTLAGMKDLITQMPQTNDQETAKTRLVQSAVCNFWCSIIFGIVAFVFDIIAYKGGALGNSIRNLIITVLSAIISMWLLRCCLNLNDKCWFIVLTVLYALSALNLALAALWSLELMAFSGVFFISAVAYTIALIVAIVLLVYAICYLKHWAPGAGAV